MRKKNNLEDKSQVQTVKWRTRSVVWSVVPIACLMNACANEPTGRRSAVDTAKLCNGDTDAVFAGSCIQRGASLGRVDDGAGRFPGEQVEPAPGEGKLQAPSGGTATTSGGTETTSGGTATTSGGTATTSGGTETTSGGTETTSGGTETTSGGTETTSGGTATTSGGTATTSGGSRVSEPVVRTVTFSQDSFVAIASMTVTSNCFVPAGTKIEFTGDVAPVTQFKSYGVSQNMVFKVSSATLPGSSASACALEGKNIVYLAKHATLSPMP